jgi:hypothetical protein
VKEMTWGEVIGGLAFAALVGGAAILTEQSGALKPEPDHYSVSCFDAAGVVRYEDSSQWAPSVYRNSKFTCVIKGMEKKP